MQGEAIPLQTRMMTIADIYDALTAQDRPYKRALPAIRALDILTDEVGARPAGREPVSGVCGGEDLGGAEASGGATVSW